MSAGDDEWLDAPETAYFASAFANTPADVGIQPAVDVTRKSAAPHARIVGRCTGEFANLARWGKERRLPAFW